MYILVTSLHHFTSLCFPCVDSQDSAMWGGQKSCDLWSMRSMCRMLKPFCGLLDMKFLNLLWMPELESRGISRPRVSISFNLFPSVPICSLCCDVWDLVPGVCVRSSTVRICAFSSKLQGGGQRPQRDSSRLPRLPGFKFWLGLQTGGNRIVRQDMAGLLRYQWLSVQQYTPCWTGRLLTELSARPVLSATSAGVCAAVVTWKSWSYIDRTAELCHVWCEPWS